MTSPILATSVAVVREGRVLLACRTREPLRGLYSLPGGRVEAGETLAAAALRELREEVAVQARIVAFNRHVELIDREPGGVVRQHYVIASFVAAWLAGEGNRSEETSDVLWVTPVEATALATTAGLIPVIEGALALMPRAGMGR